MSVNNSLITKQHDRSFISTCHVVHAAIRVYDVCVCGRRWVVESGRLQVRTEVSKRRLASKQVHGVFFACTQSFVSSWFCYKDEFLHRCTLITLPWVNILLTGKGKHEENSQYVSFCTLWNYLNGSASSSPALNFYSRESSLALPTSFFKLCLLNGKASMVTNCHKRAESMQMQRGDKCPTLCLVGS